MQEKRFVYIFPPKIDPIDLVCTGFGYEHAVPGMTWGPASRNEYVIHYVFSGKGILHNTLRIFPVSSGQMFVIPPGETAMYVADNEEPWYYCFANFQTTADLFPPDQFVFTDHRFDIIFYNILHLSKEGINEPYSVCAELLNIFSIIATSTAEEAPTRQRQYVDNACSYIHEFYNWRIRVSDLARHVNVDRAYLYTLFRKYLGVSPKEYLTNYRMVVATKLLTEHHHSIKEVALACGYTDIYTFSKVFKQHFGCSPGKYAHDNGVAISKENEEDKEKEVSLSEEPNNADV